MWYTIQNNGEILDRVNMCFQNSTDYAIIDMGLGKTLVTLMITIITTTAIATTTASVTATATITTLKLP